MKTFKRIRPAVADETAGEAKGNSQVHQPSRDEPSNFVHVNVEEPVRREYEVFVEVTEPVQPRYQVLVQVQEPVQQKCYAFVTMKEPPKEKPFVYINEEPQRGGRSKST